MDHDRYLEFAPKHWRATRRSALSRELQLPLGQSTVPPPLSDEQAPPD